MVFLSFSCLSGKEDLVCEAEGRGAEGRVRDVPGSSGSRLLLPTLDSKSLHGSWLLLGLVAASRGCSFCLVHQPMASTCSAQQGSW